MTRTASPHHTRSTHVESGTSEISAPTALPLRSVTRRRPRTRRALSLIEVVCVTVIISIAGAIAVPRYVNSVGAYRVEAASMRIMKDMAMFAQRARSEHTSITVAFDPATETYKVSDLTSLDRRSTDYSVDLGAAPYLCDLSSVDFNSTTEVTFDPYGRPDNAGQFKIASGDHTVVIRIDGSSGRAYIVP